MFSPDPRRLALNSFDKAMEDGWCPDSALPNFRTQSIFRATKGDDSKNEVIGFLRMEEVVSVDCLVDNCDFSGGVKNWVEKAGDVWSDTFMRKMAAYLAGD